ncbi:unnamed protein product [Lymnaea stagnalis]|uniref:Uncharacterized protein n=1 Tax=Lymnaea stagnalis TaxID=6523 RepID=A0AAV2ITL4_LYMST
MLTLLDSLQTSHWILLSAVTVLTSYLWLSRPKKRPLPPNTPPFPTPPTFLFGHLTQLAGNSRATMRQWRAMAGDVYSLNFRGQHYIVINGYKTFKDVLVKHADKVSDPPSSFLNRILKENNKGIAESNGENWKEQRNVSMSILKSFGLGKNLLAEKIQNEVSSYTDELASYQGRAVDVRILTTVSISNIICSITVGRRFTHDDPYFVGLINHMSRVTKYIAWLPLLTFFPFLYYVPGDLFYAKRLVASFREINTMFSLAHIHQIKETAGGVDLQKPENFIAAYLEEMKKRQRADEPTQMDEANLVAVIRNLFIAGTDTASAIILWCLLYLLHHPDIQSRAQEEIVASVGKGRAVCMEDKPKLPFLNAVIMETQRISSITPFATPRAVRTGFETLGYAFPEGSIVLPNIDSVLHDEQVWADPSVFRPDRFLDETGGLRQPEEFIPFSIGRRVCLGESMAKMELFLFLSGILQRFRLEAAEPGALPPLKEVYGAICCPESFKIKFVER